MFNQSEYYSDTYDREKLKILQALNCQIQTMALKLDQIVSQAEENIFKIKSNSSNNFRESLMAINNCIDNKPIIFLNDKISTNSITPLAIPLSTTSLGSQPTLATSLSKLLNQISPNEIKLANNQQIIKIVDQPPQLNRDLNETKANINSPTSTLQTVITKKFYFNSSRTKKSIANLTNKTNNLNQDEQQSKSTISEQQQQLLNPIKEETSSKSEIIPNSNQSIKPRQEAHAINKRNKQQRIFNTFVRESINQLLGSDFMRTHDVQDIDAQVMEMIRKEAVENYLPDNIRPRRAWHLAKASLRTLKRTLNNRKTK